MNGPEEVDGGYSLEHHVEGESRRLDAPLRLVDLSSEDAELRQGEPWHDFGQEAKTLLKLSGLRVVLISLRAGSRIERHQTEGEITIHTLAGHLRVHVDGRSIDLPAGRLLAIERSLPHDLEAAEDSSALLTIAWRRTAR
jgi:quercetin dioxygenase-like cupin family protein